MLKLYDYELSGNCYKVRLLLNMLDVEYESHTVEFYPAAEHRSDKFLAINPLGQLPVLQHEALRLRDSQAILTYLACQYDKGGTWYPVTEPARLAQVVQWLCFAQEVGSAISAARLAEGFFYDIDIDASRNKAHQHLRILDEHLWFQEREQQQWVAAGAAPTIADLACFAYTILSEEGGIERIEYPAIRRWTDRVKRLPGFTVMPGVFPAGPDIAG